MTDHSSGSAHCPNCADASKKQEAVLAAIAALESRLVQLQAEVAEMAAVIPKKERITKEKLARLKALYDECFRLQ